MKIRAAMLGLAIVLSLPACSNDVSKKDQGNGSCVQENKIKFLGITLNTDRSIVNC